MKNKEERIKKITTTSVVIIGLIISVYGYIMYFINSIENKWWRLGIVTAFILLTFIVMFLGREKIFHKILKIFWIPNSRNRILLGQWNIFIFFNHNRNADRTGILKFEDSYAGLSIIGDNLTDNEGNVTAEKWFAQDVEIHHFDNRIILVYQYWVQDNPDNNDNSKLGTVIATSTDSGRSFDGFFNDTIIDTGERRRWGKVKLNHI